MRARPIHTLLAAALLGSALVSCSPLVESGSCVSWIDASDPQVAYDESEAVVIGTAHPTSKTAKLFGVQAAVHEIEIAEVVKGTLDGADTLLVASTPVTCTGGEMYPDGDPLDVEGEQILFLRGPSDGERGWRLITPLDTVLPAPADGTLPFATS